MMNTLFRWEVFCLAVHVKMGSIFDWSFTLLRILDIIMVNYIYILFVCFVGWLVF